MTLRIGSDAGPGDNDPDASVGADSADRDTDEQAGTTDSIDNEEVQTVDESSDEDVANQGDAASGARADTGDPSAGDATTDAGAGTDDAPTVQESGPDEAEPDDEGDAALAEAGTDEQLADGDADAGADDPQSLADGDTARGDQSEADDDPKGADGQHDTDASSDAAASDEHVVETDETLVTVESIGEQDGDGPISPSRFLALLDETDDADDRPFERSQPPTSVPELDTDDSGRSFWSRLGPMLGLRREPGPVDASNALLANPNPSPPRASDARPGPALPIEDDEDVLGETADTDSDGADVGDDERSPRSNRDDPTVDTVESADGGEVEDPDEPATHTEAERGEPTAADTADEPASVPEPDEIATSAIPTAECETAVTTTDHQEATTDTVEDSTDADRPGPEAGGGEGGGGADSLTPAAEPTIQVSDDADGSPQSDAGAKSEPVVADTSPGTALVANDQVDDALQPITATAAPAPAERRGSVWSAPQLVSVLGRAAVVLAIFAVTGFLFGAVRGETHVARTELVYTLDESVPDSFLREDRRLLTQVATLQSDAVLVPVGERFGLTADELRSKIDVETVDLSEVLELEVRDSSEATALAIGDAVLAQYLTLSNERRPDEDSEALQDRRDTVVTDLAAADTALLELQQARRDDPQLATDEDSLERQIDLAALQAERLQGLLDDGLAQPLSSTQAASIEAELTATEQELVELEAALADVRTRRAELAEQSADESGLVREIERLESELATVDAEIANRDLGPLVTSPVRVLSDQTVTTISRSAAGLQGMAVGLLLALPVAALIAYRTRKRQLWLG